MAAPEVPIEVDASTGRWSVDGLPMILVPQHFLLNNHFAVEEALGPDRLEKILRPAGRRSAYFWCEQEAARHGLGATAVFHHYMKRLSQRGWAQFMNVRKVPATRCWRWVSFVPLLRCSWTCGRCSRSPTSLRSSGI